MRLPAKLVAITYMVLGWEPFTINVLDESNAVGFVPLGSNEYEYDDGVFPKFSWENKTVNLFGPGVTD
jgi:hypothetical protein